MYYIFETLAFLLKSVCCKNLVPISYVAEGKQVLPFALVDTVGCYIIRIADTKHQL